MKKKRWWEIKPYPKYIKGYSGDYYKEGVDFEYGEDGYIKFKTGGGLLPRWAKPTTEEQYLKKRKAQ